jgi:biopolymer transport protein ExbB/biopolymer transport protein TolQ
MQVSLLELWNAAGAFARGIIILLAIMSLFSLTIAGAKWWRFRKSMRETRKFTPEFARFLQEEQLEQAIAVAEKQKVSHVARVLGEALVEIKLCCAIAPRSPRRTSTRRSGRWTGRC